MPTLLLIRHGENDYLKNNKMPGRLPGIHLNKRGEEQAALLAATLGRLPLTALYASPLERAIETARPLAAALGLEIQIRAELTDTDVGEWTGRSWKALRHLKVWKIIQETPSRFRFPGGESFAECQRRITAALDTIAAAHEAGQIAAVFFHADPIKLALAHYLGLPLDNFQKLNAAPGSVSIISIGAAGARIVSMNLLPPFDAAAYFPPAPKEPPRK